jgi:hypothetical protein
VKELSFTPKEKEKVLDPRLTVLLYDKLNKELKVTDIRLYNNKWMPEHGTRSFKLKEGNAGEAFRKGNIVFLTQLPDYNEDPEGYYEIFRELKLSKRKTGGMLRKARSYISVPLSFDLIKRTGKMNETIKVKWHFGVLSIDFVHPLFSINNQKLVSKCAKYLNENKEKLEHLLLAIIN